ncbi:MAG: hypothetical protein IT196_02165 [Acidimicrobiales bacterium]|nr:hypothetical protein [Acidimicrobiales bacterium]
MSRDDEGSGQHRSNGQAKPTPGRRASAGRVTPKPVPRRDTGDELPALRRRSPLAYWVAVLVLVGMVATLLGGVLAGLAR